MKAKEKETEKNFDTVKTFRKIKEKISEDLASMSFEEIQVYLEKESKKLYLDSSK